MTEKEIGFFEKMIGEFVDRIEKRMDKQDIRDDARFDRVHSEIGSLRSEQKQVQEDIKGVKKRLKTVEECDIREDAKREVKKESVLDYRWRLPLIIGTLLTFASMVLGVMYYLGNKSNSEQKPAIEQKPPAAQASD